MIYIYKYIYTYMASQKRTEKCSKFRADMGSNFEQPEAQNLHIDDSARPGISTQPKGRGFGVFNALKLSFNAPPETH